MAHETPVGPTRGWEGLSPPKVVSRTNLRGDGTSPSPYGRNGFSMVSDPIR